jgi:hypothetical protein
MRITAPGTEKEVGCDPLSLFRLPITWPARRYVQMNRAQPSIFTGWHDHAVSGQVTEVRWAVVSLQKPEIFLLCHLPSIDLVKDAPVKAENAKL